MIYPLVTLKGIYEDPFFITDYGSKIFLGHEWCSYKEVFIIFQNKKAINYIPIEEKS